MAVAEGAPGMRPGCERQVLSSVQVANKKAIELLTAKGCWPRSPARNEDSEPCGGETLLRRARMAGDVLPLERTWAGSRKVRGQAAEGSQGAPCIARTWPIVGLVGCS